MTEEKKAKLQDDEPYYKKALRELPEHVRKALIDGDWDAVKPKRDEEA